MLKKKMANVKSPGDANPPKLRSYSGSGSDLPESHHGVTFPSSLPTYSSHMDATAPFDCSQNSDMSACSSTTSADIPEPIDSPSGLPDHLKPRRKIDKNRRTRSLYGASPNFRFGPKASIMKNQANVLTIQDPASQRLNWYSPPLSVLVIKKIFDDSVAQPFVELVQWLVQEKKMIVWIETKVCEDPLIAQDGQFTDIFSKVKTFTEGQDDLTDKVDLIICLGGDGTLLYASSLFQGSVPPVMAFHMGSLGFLTPFDFTFFRERITQVMEGNAALMLRTRLKCVVCSRDSTLPSIKHVESKCQRLVLNEVVVDRGPSPYLSNLDLFIEGRYVTSVQGDGLIISTPTGSTAYSAAAGASMLHPNVPAILITPVCPHSLSFRPIVLPAGVEVKVMVSPDARNSVWVSFDGRSRQELAKNDSLRITTSIFPVPSICSEDQIADWFNSLASCLHWNVRRSQRAFTTTPSLDSLELSDQNGQDNNHS